MKRVGGNGRLEGRGWRSMGGVLALAVLGALLMPAFLHADDGAPARAARLSYADGQVSVQQGGQVLAQQAVANTPLFEGMQVSTGNDGRAEIQFDDGSIARLAPNSALTLTVLRGSGQDGDTEMSLDNGLGYFELQDSDQSGQMGVHFGDSVATVTGYTVLRVDMDMPPGELADFSGNVHLDQANGAMDVDLHGGESVTLNGNDPSAYNLAESIEPDSWDTWNSDRDQALTTETAQEAGAPDNLPDSSNPAWSDMAANGDWYDVPGQGYVWSPYVAASADWDPYGCGQWMWTPQFGYIWVSCYNWGYMPFIAGSWSYYDGLGWGWSPGYGGYSPWWSAGYYRGPNIGYAPGGYEIVRRPTLSRRPEGLGQIPVLRVDRLHTPRTGRLAMRKRNQPVLIGGQRVEPLRPTPGSAGGGFMGHPQPSYPVIVGGGRTARVGNHAPRPVYGTGGSGATIQRRNPDNSFGQPAHGVTPPPNRSYNPPQRTSMPPQRTVTPSPGRVYTPPPSRPYSPPPSRPAGGGFSGGHNGGFQGGGHAGGGNSAGAGNHR